MTRSRRSGRCDWQGQQDLNLRRAGLESAALAGLSYAPLTRSVCHLPIVTRHGILRVVTRHGCGVMALLSHSFVEQTCSANV